MNTAEELGASFGFDVTDGAFWTASLDVIRTRIAAVRRTGRRPSHEHHAVHPESRGVRRAVGGEPRYRLDQVWAGLYTQLARTGRHHHDAQGAARAHRARSAHAR
jgi:hypothetical protein